MGIAIGTTITVTFDARQIAQLDCVLQEFDMQNWEQKNEHEKINVERVNNIFKALHEAGYRQTETPFGESRCNAPTDEPIVRNHLKG